MILGRRTMVRRRTRMVEVGIHRHHWLAPPLLLGQGVGSVLASGVPHNLCQLLVSLGYGCHLHCVSGLKECYKL